MTSMHTSTIGTELQEAYRWMLDHPEHHLPQDGVLGLVKDLDDHEMICHHHDREERLQDLSRQMAMRSTALAKESSETSNRVVAAAMLQIKKVIDEYEERLNEILSPRH